MGVFFILMGTGALLKRLGLWDLGDIISTWWPLILVAYGILQLSSNPVSKTSGIIILVVGVLFQVKNLDIFDFNIGELIWPLIVISLGVSILFPRNTFRGKSKFNTEESNGDVVEKISLFSAIKTRSISHNFRGGSLVAAFGGIDLDLSVANLSNDSARIDVTVAFGGINIMVPKDWRVEMKGIPLFGGWSNKTNSSNSINEFSPVLIVNCFTAFGGVTVKN